MKAHDWYIENRSAFVARSLERAEERTFIDHLVRCDECTREVARLERDLAWLPLGVTPVAPAPGLPRRIASRILDRPSPWRRAVPYGLAAALALLAIGVGARGRAERARLEAQLAARDQRLAALQDTLSIVQGAQQILQAKISMNGHDGGLVIFQEPVSHRWCVVVHGLPPAPSGNVYQFWFITTSGMVRSVEVRGDPGRPAVMTLGMPPVAAPVRGAALTVEPAVNRSTEPRGPMLAHVTF
jgi:anti-sigma-K factor RskA